MGAFFVWPYPTPLQSREVGGEAYLANQLYLTFKNASASLYGIRISLVPSAKDATS